MKLRLAFAFALAISAIDESALAAAATPPEGRVDNPALIAPEQGAPRGNLLWRIPLKTLTATRDRPIFRPSRRPLAGPVAGTVEPVNKVESAPEPPRLALVGTVAGGNDGIAVFVNQSTQVVLRLRTGEGLDGWIVREVRGREVVLERGQETVVFALPAATDEKK